MAIHLSPINVAYTLMEPTRNLNERPFPDGIPSILYLLLFFKNVYWCFESDPYVLEFAYRKKIIFPKTKRIAPRTLT